MNEKANEPLTYKGHPLLRKQNIIYYGDMSEKCIIMMQILKSEKQGDLDVATRVSVQMIQTDETLPMKERIVKHGEKPTLWAALDIASIWLDRALAAK